MSHLLHSSRYGLTTALACAVTGLLVALFRESQLPVLFIIILGASVLGGIFALLTIPFERMGDK